MLTRREMLQRATAGALLPLGLRSAAARARIEASALGTLRAVTITAANLDVVEAAWAKFMGYRVVSRGRLPQATAAGWGAPALSGKAYIILGPESGEPTYLRFVEQPMPEGYDPAHTLGWSTTEITVQNTDQLYERLKNSPFKVARPPSQIPTYPYLKAMQAIGPAGERLNLTWITEPRPDLAVAKSFVGRCFIAVQGAPDLPASLDFFHDTFGNVPSAIRKLPSIELAVVPLQDGTKIEVDHYGPTARQRERPAGGLPPGLAVVTFECSRFGDLRKRFIARPTLCAIEPHLGRSTATLQGPAGELIELVDA
jgi:hypothetical protein